jgi:hypothetical protein
MRPSACGPTCSPSSSVNSASTSQLVVSLHFSSSASVLHAVPACAAIFAAVASTSSAECSLHLHCAPLAAVAASAPKQRRGGVGRRGGLSWDTSCETCDAAVGPA